MAVVKSFKTGGIIRHKIYPHIMQIAVSRDLDSVIGSEGDMHNDIALHRYGLAVDEHVHIVFGEAEEKLIEHRMRM